MMKNLAAIAAIAAAAAAAAAVELTICFPPIIPDGDAKGAVVEREQDDNDG